MVQRGVLRNAALAAGRMVRPILVAMALVMAMSACGAPIPVNAETSAQATRKVRDSYVATVDARTAAVSVHLEMIADVAGRTERAQLTGSGQFDFAGKKSQTALLTPLGIRIEVRTVGVHFYEKAPPQLRKRFPGNRPWMRFNFEAADIAQYGSPLYVFRPDSADDPWQVLGFLPAASSARFVGSDFVRDRSTRHYQATVRLADLVALGGPRTGPGRRRFQQTIGIDVVPIEAWIDEAGRLRRLRATVPVRLAGADWTATDDVVRGQATATLEFFDFGLPVSVTAPPVEQTDDLTDLVSQRGLAAVGEIVGAI